MRHQRRSLWKQNPQVRARRRMAGLRDSPGSVPALPGFSSGLDGNAEFRGKALREGFLGEEAWDLAFVGCI